MKFKHSQRIIEQTEELLRCSQTTTYELNTKQRKDLNQQQEGGHLLHLLLLKRRKELQQQLDTAEEQQRDLQRQVEINKDNKRKLQIASIDQSKNPLKRPYRTLARTSQGTAKEIAIQLDDQHQDKMKRRTAECLQRNKKIGATIQDEDEEYMLGHSTESGTTMNASKRN